MSASNSAAPLQSFHASGPTGQGTLLTFKGVEGYDVYNCSAPFKWKGKWHIYGRVEKREHRNESRSRMFVSTAEDGVYTVIDSLITRQLEDPFVAKVGGAFVLGGTQVVKDVGAVFNHYCDLYRGAKPEQLVYFTTGPDHVRHLRLVSLADGSVGIFTQQAVRDALVIAFTVAPSLAEVTREAAAQAVPIDSTAFGGASGGVTQAHLLSSGRIGCLARHWDGESCATSFVFDPATNATSDFRTLATQSYFPGCASKDPQAAPTATASGLVLREDGRCDLYCGVGDTSEGRITIDYPFEGHGHIVDDISLPY